DESEALPQRVGPQDHTDEVGKRIADDERDDRRRERIPEGAQEDLTEALEHLEVVLPAERVYVLADLERSARLLETREHKRNERGDEGRDEVQDAGGEQDDRDVAATSRRRVGKVRPGARKGTESHVRPRPTRLRAAAGAALRWISC